MNVSPMCFLLYILFVIFLNISDLPIKKTPREKKDTKILEFSFEKCVYIFPIVIIKLITNFGDYVLMGSRLIQ